MVAKVKLDLIFLPQFTSKSPFIRKYDIFLVIKIFEKGNHKENGINDDDIHVHEAQP